MKTYFLSLILIFSVIVSFGQYNIPTDIDDNYCHHIKAGINSLKSYNAPLTVNPLMEKYDVTFYFLDLEVENNTVSLNGSVTIKAKSMVSSLDTIAFELYPGMTIDQVTVNNAVHSFQQNDYLVTVPLDAPVLQGSFFSVKVTYHGTPPTGGFFSGISTDYNTDYQKDVTWTLSEPYAARDWWPVKQDLTDKADSVWVFLTTSAGNKAGSEGLLTAITPMPGGKVRYEWKSNYPIDYYLISFAVADYMEYNLYAHPEGTDDSVFIQNFIYNDPDCLATNQAGLDRTADFIELYSDLFGLYPFINEKYGHCLTELGGGMEHQTMTTIGGFSFTLVAHELGHMWFGDKVTCATWSDIWINEGFATYCDYLAHSFLADPIYDSIWLKLRHDNVKSQPGGSVYVPPDQLDDIWRIFDGRLSYNKGALLLHMIRFELQDDDLFFNILESYVNEYGDSVATGDNFRDWVELQSGKDFTDFFNQWYYGEGYPVYDIVWNQTNDTLNIYSTQTTSTNVTTLFRMTVPFHLKFGDGTDTTLLFYQDANQVAFSYPVSKSIEQLEVDPDQWILHRLNSISVGIEDKESPVYFSIGPNPANDRLNVFLGHQSVKTVVLNISDLSGRSILKAGLSKTIETIDISRLNAGVYLVSVNDGSDNLIKKLIVE
jgi:aminopeptidase N